MHARGRGLFARLWDGLGQIRGVTRYGLAADAARTPTVAFTLNGRRADAVAEELARSALFLSSGDFYAWTVVLRLGHAEDGLIRAGCAIYTTEDEIERLLEGVALAARGV
jgi:selenocysteine lyase/cysteine desulfurase